MLPYLLMCNKAVSLQSCKDPLLAWTAQPSGPKSGSYDVSGIACVVNAHCSMKIVSTYILGGISLVM